MTVLERTQTTLRNPDNIPEALKKRPQWVLWRYENGTKVPYSVKGYKASSTKPGDWASFSAAVHRLDRGGYDGIGYVFSPNDPYTGIDLDNCIDDAGNMAAWAQSIISDMGSYAEISPSERGVKVWVEGTIPDTIGHTKFETGAIEMYDQARYFTVTGNAVAGVPRSINYVNGSLTSLHNRVTAARGVAAAKAAQPVALPVGSDGEFLRRWALDELGKHIAMNATNAITGEKGGKHDRTRDSAAYLSSIASKGLLSESEIEEGLFSAVAPYVEDTTGHNARQTIRDGIRYGSGRDITLPTPPLAVMFDEAGIVCCAIHTDRLIQVKDVYGCQKCLDDGNKRWWSDPEYVPPAVVLPVKGIDPVTGEIIAHTTGDNQHASVPPKYVHSSQLHTLPKPDWLFSGEIVARGFNCLYGGSGIGKSFRALDYACSASQLGAVIYVAAEDPGGYIDRVEAWKQHNQKDTPGLFFWPEAVNALDHRSVDLFIAQIKPLDPVLVILDTLMRCIPGGSDSDPKDMGMFIGLCDRVRMECGAASLAIHHTGKDGNYRGHSSLPGAADMFLRFENKDGLLVLTVEKAKNSKEIDPIKLRMMEVGASCVLVPHNKVAPQYENEFSPPQMKVMEALCLNIFAGKGATVLTLTEITGIPKSSVYYTLSMLRKRGYIDYGQGSNIRATQLGIEQFKGQFQRSNSND